MRIKSFNTDKKVLIVAEIGNNHEGNFDVAQELVRKAAEAGADAVKFQTFQTEHYVSSADEVRFKRLKSFELTHEQFTRLATLAHSLGLLFISTPFDLGSAAFLGGIVDSFKIASGDNNFWPLIKAVAETGKPMIVSTGLSRLTDVKKTVQFVKDRWRKKHIKGELAILHCVSSYPVPPEGANLGAIPVLARTLDCTVGYSDHTMGEEAAVLAVALGARVIEKHFTLDHHYSDFRDHQLSSDPAGLKELVRRVRLVSEYIGEQTKALQKCEEGNVKSLRRTTVAGRDMEKGHVLKNGDFTWIRSPRAGLASGEESRLVGKKLKRAVVFGDPILAGDVARA